MTQQERVSSVEDKLAGVASFMTAQGLQGVLIEGTLENKKPYEGISFMDSEGEEVARIRFSEGRPLPADSSEVERRLRIPGLITEVLRPVQRAAAGVYNEGSDLLDERFDVLPGFTS